MPNSNEVEELFVTTTEIDGRSYAITVRIAFDGVEHVGNLLFRDADWEDDEGVTDHGTIPGRTTGEILTNARALTEHDLALRHRRAVTERRRFNGLRQITGEVLAQIRYRNKVATSMRAGLLDVEEAASEIASTEQRLHDMVGQLRNFAGVAS
jgi:hypothetical protein